MLFLQGGRCNGVSGHLLDRDVDCTVDWIGGTGGWTALANVFGGTSVWR